MSLNDYSSDEEYDEDVEEEEEGEDEEDNDSSVEVPSTDAPAPAAADLQPVACSEAQVLHSGGRSQVHLVLVA